MHPNKHVRGFKVVPMIVRLVVVPVTFQPVESRINLELIRRNKDAYRTRRATMVNLNLPGIVRELI